jgi:hypothetical protein
MLAHTAITCYHSGGLGKSYATQEAALQEGPLALLPEKKKQKMLVATAKIANVTKHEVECRKTSARSKTDIAVASAMSATLAVRYTKVLSASEIAAQAALWALLNLAPRIGITNIPKGDDFLTAPTPEHHPAVSTWWERTSAEQRAQRLKHYVALGNPEFRRLATALDKSIASWRSEENATPGRAESRAKARKAAKCEHNTDKWNCVVRIVSTANFQTDNITESCANIRNAPFYIAVRRVQHLPLRKAKRQLHLHRLQK